MPRPHSDDLRMRAIKKMRAGESRRSVTKQLCVAALSVIKSAGRYSDTGSAGPSWMGTRRAPKLATYRAWNLKRSNSCPAVTFECLKGIVFACRFTRPSGASWVRPPGRRKSYCLAVTCGYGYNRLNKDFLLFPTL